MQFSELHSDAPLSENELSSIKAIVAWLEHNRGFHVEGTKCHLEAEFCVTDFKDIKRSDYDRAVKYLIDLEEVRAN